MVAMSIDVPLDARPKQVPHSRTTLTGLPIPAARGVHLRVWRLADGTMIDPFPDWSTSWGGQWSPDGSRLAAFVHNPTGALRLAVWQRDTEAVHILAGDAGSYFTFERPQWTRDGTALITELRSAPTDRPLPAPVEPGPELSVTVLATRDGEARRDFAKLDSADLALVGLDGSRRILARGWTVRGWRLSPDSSRVACLRVDPTANDDSGFSYELAVITLDDGAMKIVARGIGQNYGVSWSWSPDGARIVYLHRQAGQLDELWLADPNGGADPILLSDGGGRWPPWPRSIDPGSYEVPRWIDRETVLWHRAGTGFVRFTVPATDSGQSSRPSPKAELVAPLAPGHRGEVWLAGHDDNLTGTVPFAAVNTAEGGCEVQAIDLRSGQRSVLATCPGNVSISPLHVGHQAGRSLSSFVLDGESGSSELWIADDRSARKVASLNPDLHWPHQARRLFWRGDRPSGGAARMGALFAPLSPPPSSGYPLVISVYGGGYQTYLADEPDPMAGVLHTSLLTSRGFATLYPDLPVSEDRLPMEQFAESVRPAIDQVGQEVPIDRGRISLIGNSYGSYTVLSLLVTMAPDTFAAAVVTAPVINPLSSYGSLDSTGYTFLSYWETGQGGLRTPPWEDPATWVANSPYLRLDRVTTPILIGVGSAGIPGEQAQADQLYTGLRRLGRPAELRKYDREDHSPLTWSVGAYRDFATRCLEWLDRPPTE